MDEAFDDDWSDLYEQPVSGAMSYPGTDDETANVAKLEAIGDKASHTVGFQAPSIAPNRSFTGSLPGLAVRSEDVVSGAVAALDGVGKVRAAQEADMSYEEALDDMPSLEEEVRSNLYDASGSSLAFTGGSSVDAEEKAKTTTLAVNLEEPHEVTQDTLPANGSSFTETTVGATRPQHADEDGTQEALQGVDQVMMNSGSAGQSKKSAHDPEFLAAAQENKSDEKAEWQLDSSGADSQDTKCDASPDSSSEEKSDDDDYEMLDAETMAKILMSGDFEDEDHPNKTTGDKQPRTQNEKPEIIIPKPDVTVTPEMIITYLGAVENIVESWVLIKAATSGDYQVLESGSVLCLENREVIGVVLEPLGRVHDPFYLVAFTNAEEIGKAGIMDGTKIYYVDQHSTFVFTQPLMKLKGTDASNVHDEEVGEEERDFSEDEAEAEYKRKRKLARRGGRGGSAARGGRGGFSGESNGYSDPPPYSTSRDGDNPSNGGSISYDDEIDVADEMYTPLRRPDSLSQLMAGRPPPPLAQRNIKPWFDRGRGRGRVDKGRGGRGRGDRRMHDRGGRGADRGGRGGRGGRQSQTIPDNHNYNERPRSSYLQGSQRLDPAPLQPQQSWSPPVRQQATGYGQDVYQAQNTHQQSPPLSAYQQSPPQSAYQPPIYQPPPPQSYQFNGNAYQYQGVQPQVQQPRSTTPGGSAPAGAYFNPTFFQSQPYSQLQWPQQQQNQWAGQQYQQPVAGAWNTQQQQQHAQTGAAAPSGPPDLAEILRTLSEQPR